MPPEIDARAHGNVVHVRPVAFEAEQRGVAAASFVPSSPTTAGEDRSHAMTALTGCSRRSRTLPLAPADATRELGDIAAERRDLAVQRRLHLSLHTWLLIHVPLTAALLTLLGAHVWFAVRYTY